MKKTMEWSNDDSLLLIQEYRKHSVLWDPKNKWHFNKTKKTNAWNEISSTLDVDVEEAKRKMTSLLSSFRRERSRWRKTMGTQREPDESYDCNWFAFRSLCFLLKKRRMSHKPNSINDIITTGESDESENLFMDSLSPTATSSLEEPPSTPQFIKLETGNLEPQIESPTETSNFIKPSKPSVRKRPRKQRQKDPLPDQEIQFEFLDQNSTHSSSLTTTQDDPSSIYAQYVASKLRQFRGRARALLEHDINELIFDAEMGKYDYISPKTYNSSSPSFFISQESSQQSATVNEPTSSGCSSQSSS